MGIDPNIAPTEGANNVIPFPAPEMQGLAPEVAQVTETPKSTVATIPVTMNLSADQIHAIADALGANDNVARAA